MVNRITFTVSFELPDRKAAQWLRERPSRWDMLQEIQDAIKSYWDNDARLMAVEIERLDNDGGVQSTKDSSPSRSDGTEVTHWDSAGGVNGGS